MKHSKFLKGTTLLGFVMMLSAFVAYRSGAFNNNSVAAFNNRDYKMSVDSPLVKPMIMPSSKSGPIFENPQSNGTTAATATSTYVPKDVMPSSKSAGVFHGDDVYNPPPTPFPGNTKNKGNNSNRSNAPANQNNKPK